MAVTIDEEVKPFEQILIESEIQGEAEAQARADEIKARELAEIESLYRELGVQPSIDDDQLASSTEINEYLIEDALVRNQPHGIAGPSKAMKTTIAIDAAVSLATGSPFLGVHAVPKPVKVIFFTGEIGIATNREIRNRISYAKVVKAGQRLRWSHWAPHILDDKQMRIVSHELELHKPEVAFFDPLYLMLDGETQANYALNGQQLRRICKLCTDIGITPILIDHAKRSSQNAKEHEPLELDDISGAGKAEFFRQWWLVSRRQVYYPDKPHELWLSIGGSAGHSSLWALTIDESRDANHQRTYSLTVKARSDVMEEKKAARKDKKAQAAAMHDERIAKKATELLSKVFKGDTLLALTKSDVREYLRLNAADAGQVLAYLVQADSIRMVAGAVKKHGKPYDGYMLVESLFSQPDKPDKVDTSGPSPGEADKGTTEPDKGL